jgi:hypothetical protein
MFISKFSNLLKSDSGKYMISAILGLGLASLFRKICDDNNCVVYRGSTTEEVVDKTFNHNDKCYQYDIKPVTCDKKKKIVQFA